MKYLFLLVTLICASAAPAESGWFPSNPNASVPLPKAIEAAVYDTTYTQSVSGEDTTRTMTVTRRLDLEQTNAHLKSISTSLGWMAFISMAGSVAMAIALFNL